MTVHLVQVVEIEDDDFFGMVGEEGAYIPHHRGHFGAIHPVAGVIPPGFGVTGDAEVQVSHPRPELVEYALGLALAQATEDAVEYGVGETAE